MTTTGVDPGGAASGRFVRNLALSISGGAILTLLGASAAHAEDLSDAGTTSDGAGAAHSGDATAVGNKSGSNTTQNGSASGALGGLQVVNQSGNIVNTGVAVADTGGNVATGNQSINTALGTQTANGGLGAASNSGTAGNASNGSAAVSTGNASAVGNESTTTLNQGGTAAGALGGIIIIDQNALVTNSGVALASTGGNTAIGNDSESNSLLGQTSELLGGLAANQGKATNDSDGKATINTGNASAVGNKSDTTVTQSANGSAGGALGGLVIIEQVAPVVNFGLATADTGDNRAVGNSSSNNLTKGSGVNQFIGFGNPALIGVGVNSAEVANASDGTAGITTGDATAVGNDSRTTLEQDTTDDLGDAGGLALAVQASSVVNIGIASADTGDNEAIGNGSRNDLGVNQDIVGLDVGPYVGAANNSASARNSSDGNAWIGTGDAWAVGNTSTTNLTQRSEANGGDVNLLPQVAGVQNIGLANADTGENFAGGNGSDNTAAITQDVIWPEPGATVLALSIQSQSADASNTSDGSASVTTGNASAKGNVSTTDLTQTLDPTGLVIPTQVADVVNLGIGVASTGDNSAEGNISDNTGVDVDQHVHIGEDSVLPITIIAGQLVGSNSGEASNTSDGSASVDTGDASATGNDSATTLEQTSNGAIDGLGLILNTQVAVVANVGLGSADSGGNSAIGNTSQNDANLEQHAHIGSDNQAGTSTTILGGIVAAANSGSAATTSDGDASITTGDATATGNHSATTLSQTEDGTVSGLGAVVNTQAAGVLNAGVGVANSGGNLAIGNVSNNRTDALQDALIGSQNAGGPIVIGAGFVTASNQAAVDSTSDGSADITTGAATATGNASSTHLTQDTAGDISGLGLVLNTQVAGVANVGLGLANSGGNVALGNASNNDQLGGVPISNQDALIGSGNFDDPDVPVIILAPSITASNAASVSTTSDGDATVNTGAATATGNLSSTNLHQDPDSSVDGLGVVIGTQVAGVANVGVGVANSGLNLAIGNAAGQLDILQGPDSALSLEQEALIGSNNNGPGAVVILAAGPVAATNQANADNSNDGSAKVGTGAATATGNASSTDLTQKQSGNVAEMGLVVGTQVAGVANIGVGVANSGLNAAVGNASSNQAGVAQSSAIASDTVPAQPIAPIIALGPVVASNAGEVSNASDGEACVCTGDATASGNISQTTLGQDLDLSTTTGTVIVTEAGGVLNAGLGIANSGANLAVGNVSNNTAQLTQTSTINDALIGLPIVGPQIASTGGGASNTSDGVAKVGSGKATATGNQSTTSFAQAATVDSNLAVSTLAGGTSNVGLGLANSGLNLGVGNASTNSASLTQTADGAGVVANQGEATNESDGTATIGDPNCDVPTETPPETPGTTGLPRTGGPLEAEAAIALMLLLVGFGLRRKGQQLA